MYTRESKARPGIDKWVLGFTQDLFGGRGGNTPTYVQSEITL